MANAQNARALLTTVRIAAASPRMVLSDPYQNASEIIKTVYRADELGVDFLCLPELCLTGATLGTLMRHPVNMRAASAELKRICDSTKHMRIIFGVGLPYMLNGNVMSCVALVRGGRVCAIIPSTCNDAPFGFVPQVEHFYRTQQPLSPIPRLSVAFGNELFDPMPDTHAGHVMLMPSALNATAKSLKAVNRALGAYSARSGMAIAYAAPNSGESSGSFVFDGICAIAANGEIIVSSKPFEEDPLVFADIDPACLSVFEPFEPGIDDQKGYLSSDPAEAYEECTRILDLQAEALSRRLSHIHGKGFLIGVSGGLDSALALLASVAAADKMGLDRSAVVGISMPGFGTSHRTKNNSCALIETLGCTYREISVVESCRQHFADIGHDENNHNVVFENAQARERTKILLDIANAENLLDVGTGDLSEAALGFTTFGGDHLAQYGVNASLPKTVIRKVTFAAKEHFPAAADVLQSILDTPVSPELLPGNDGDIVQKTEEIVGSYELHDFFLLNMLHGKTPSEMLDLACASLDFPREEVYRVLGIFLRRFFSQQFKRNCATEAPAILASIAPSVLTMPSDMCGEAWLREYDGLMK